MKQRLSLQFMLVPHTSQVVTQKYSQCADPCVKSSVSATADGLAPFVIRTFAGTVTNMMYRKTSSISRTRFQNLNVSCIILQLSSLNPLKPGVKLRMQM